MSVASDQPQLATRPLVLQQCAMAHSYWPLFDLRIRTPRLELRYPTDEDIFAVTDVIASGIHEAGRMPFATPWSTKPSPERERSALQFQWSKRANWTTEDWDLPLVVVTEGEIIGIQSLGAKDFAICRSAGTGSWIGKAHQGRGIGKEMRAAMLYFAFEGLGAIEATTGAYEWNERSIGVTQHLGYADNGRRFVAVEGRCETERLFRMDRDRWQETARSYTEVEITGLEPCLDLFGATA